MNDWTYGMNSGHETFVEYMALPFSGDMVKHVGLNHLVFDGRRLARGEQDGLLKGLATREPVSNYRIGAFR
jgi:hypothetical protein